MNAMNHTLGSFLLNNYGLLVNYAIGSATVIIGQLESDFG